MSTHLGASAQNRANRGRVKSTRRWTIKRIFLIVLLLGVGYLGLEYFMLPSGQELQAANPTTSALIEAREREAEDEGRKLDKKQSWLPIEHISRNMLRAVLAGE